jgi:hypothetical protein
MSNYSRVVSFGASITYGSELPDQNCTWSAIIAQKLGIDYLCLAKEAASNANIARQIISYTDYNQTDLVLVMWTSATRYEFRTETGWQDISPWSEQKGFVRDWYRGPGNYEYTEVATSMKEIALATQFLEGMGLDYLFVFDNDELRTSHTWNLDDDYIQTLKLLLPWDNTIWFDKTGFLNWTKENGYPFLNTHPGIEAHQAAADYILANRDLISSRTSILPALL